MNKSKIPENKSGDWKVEKFTVTDAGAQLHNLRCAAHGSLSSIISPGDYTKLSYDGLLVMSDTPSELRDHELFIKNAKGSVLIAGLGLGLVTIEVAKKRNVTSIVIVEKSKDVIDLVWKYIPEDVGARLEIVHADIFDYKPRHGFDYAWFDIWNYICEDNKKDFELLDSKFRSRVLNMGYWSLQYLLDENYHVFEEFINDDLIDVKALAEDDY